MRLMITDPTRAKLLSFKGLILDGDGVWFTGEEYRAVLPDGQSVVMKPRHHHDGQGLSFMRAIGIQVLFATAEGEPMGSVVNKLNGLPSVAAGDWQPLTALTDLKHKGLSKVEAIEDGWLKPRRLSWGECAYIGDDRTDYEAMLRVNEAGGLSVTPSNGQRPVKKIAQLVLTKPGGGGAIREFAELVLDVRGIDETMLPPA